jgi:hypothetical protein
MILGIYDSCNSHDANIWNKIQIGFKVGFCAGTHEKTYELLKIIFWPGRLIQEIIATFQVTIFYLMHPNLENGRKIFVRIFAKTTPTDSFFIEMIKH